MTELQQLEMELNSITWTIGQANTDEERQELEQEYNSRIQEILEQIEIIKQDNNG
jgi:hypothetical protein